MKTLMAAVLALTVSAAQAQDATTYKLDTDKTVISWEGKKVAGPHDGTVKAKSGSLTVAGDVITSGNVIIDMNSIDVKDLQAGKGKENLEGHLKSADFFDVAKHPEATLVIKNSKKSAKGLDITADITIRGVTQPITFTATDVKKTADNFHAKATIVVDR